MSNIIFEIFSLEGNKVIDTYTKEEITNPVTITDDCQRSTYSVRLLRDLLLLHRDVEDETK